MFKRSTRAAVSAAAAAAAGSSRKFAYATKPTRRLPLVAAAVAIGTSHLDYGNTYVTLFAGGAVFAATSTASAAPGKFAFCSTFLACANESALAAPKIIRVAVGTQGASKVRYFHWICVC